MARRRRGERVRSDAPPGRSGRGRRVSRRVVIAGTTLIVAVAMILGAREVLHRWTRSEPPPLPNLSGHPASVAAHLHGRLAAAQNDPTSAASVGAFCLALHADMFYDEAERCYALVQRLDSHDWRWLYYAGLIQSERGGGQSFITTLQRIVDEAPAFGPAWLRLGEAEFKEQHYDRAEAAWIRAQSAPEPERAEQGPRHTADVPLAAYASLGRARIALARGDRDTARQILERLTEAAPRFASAFRLLAESHTALGRTADAQRAQWRANQLPAYAPYADPMIDVLASESRNSTFLLRQASEADLATNAEWSEYLIRRALEFDSDNPDVLSKLGRVLRTTGRNEEALEYFMAYNRMIPEDFQGLAHIGSCLGDLGRVAEAEDYLRRALAGIDDALTRYNLGVVLAAMGRLSEAIAEYSRALDRDPMELNARNNLAVALARQGRIAEASKEWQRVLTLDPTNHIARTNLDIIRGPGRP